MRALADAGQHTVAGQHTAAGRRRVGRQVRTWRVPHRGEESAHRTVGVVRELPDPYRADGNVQDVLTIEPRGGP